jgi:Holliday junction DNA helicase RuvA
MNVREGTMECYGFTNPNDLELFKILTSVSGLGPKTAMQVLSSVDPQHLKEAVVREDPQALRTVSGLGLKTAQRLVVELQDKLTYLDVGTTDAGSLDQDAQALEALMSLGYQVSQAKDALKLVRSAETLQDRVRQALQLLSKK